MKKKQTDDVADFAGAPAPKALGPADVQQKEFRVSRFSGGYKMRDVDEFLDQITESMNAMVEENRKLRTQGGGPSIGAPDLADTSRQADEIIQRARAQAEQIVRDAQRGVGAVGSDGASGSPDRAPVKAFLAKERIFLQSMAGLMNEHAESVKSMVRADRAVVAPSVVPMARPSAPPSPERAARPPMDPRPTVPIQTVDEPIRVEDPAPASARRDDDGPGDGPDRSLRELFWGED